MKTKKTITTIIFLLLGLCSLPLQAQVTIGSGLEPQQGALLDIKTKKLFKFYNNYFL
jgi:hypothetical protein